MAKINLLPWRETKRKEKQQEFLVMLGAGAALAVLVVLLVQFQFDRKITNQEWRNQLLTNEIKILDNDIKEIQKLDATRRSLIDRMEVIQNLQTTRPGIVHLFDDIATTLPAGLHLSSLSQSGNKINLAGRAESNARVSSYMRNIEESIWLANPKLTVISTDETDSLRLSEFTLVVDQSNPDNEEASEQP